MAAVGAGLAACGDNGNGTSPGPGGAATTTSANGQGGGQPDEAALRKKIASLLVAGFRGATVNPGDWVMRAITEQGLGGVILFDKDQLTNEPRNITSPDQVKSLIQNLKQANPRLIVSVDQEGGVISRLNPSNGFPAFQSEAEIGAANSPEVTRQWARNMAQTLASVGFTFNFAPVVDLNVNPTSPAVGELDRSFSADPNVVVANASEEIRQHREAKVTTSNKHFPGLGSATGNTDFSVVDVSDTWKPVELEPFRGLIANGMTDSVMVGHILNRQIDPQLPMSLSRAAVTDLLRGQLGWKGAVVSDDMQAVAITDRYSTQEAVGLALAAGMDLLVYANQQVYDPDIVTKVVDGVVALVGTGKVTETQIDEAVARVDALRH
jgi:beta-N-acetylhexosaminidase